MVDNFIKGPLTSILGIIIFVAALVGWWLPETSDYALTDGQAVVIGLLGVILCFVKDKIPDFVVRVFNGLFGRWFPNAGKDEQPKP